MEKKSREEPRYHRERSRITCKTMDIGLESFQVCLEKEPQKCRFSLNFGDTYFCRYSHQADNKK